MRGMWICQISIAIAFCFVFTIGNENYASRMGGFVSGFLGGLWFAERFDSPGGLTIGLSPYEKACRYAGLFTLAVLLMISIFYIFWT